MKAVAIVGFKKSGKTALVNALAKFLKKKGRVGIIKHCHGPIEVSAKDKAFLSGCQELAVVADAQTSLIKKRSAKLQDLLSVFDADYVLVEGFKQEKTLPRIVCYNTRKEKKELSCGLEIGFVKNNALSRAEIKKLAQSVIGQGFNLPGLNCAKCGFKTCFDLARQIVKDEQKPCRCVYLNSKARLWIDDKPVFMNFFVNDILKNVVCGFVRSLKGAKKSGKIRIELNQ